MTTTPAIQDALPTTSDPAVRSTPLVGRPRGSVKRYREHLNALDVGDSKHMHLHYQQRTRKYGDYLYNQDRERFMVELDDWLKSPNTELTDRRGAGSVK